MKRLGMYSGKIYEADYDTSKIEECCVTIYDVQAEDKEWITNQHNEHKKVCNGCFGCPLSNEY